MAVIKKDPKTNEAMGTGRRKSSVARVRIKDGKGNVVINGKDFKEYFPNAADQRAIIDTMNAVGVLESVDIRITVSGGGSTGQSGAVSYTHLTLPTILLV